MSKTHAKLLGMTRNLSISILLAATCLLTCATTSQAMTARQRTRGLVLGTAEAGQAMAFNPFDVSSLTSPAMLGTGMDGAPTNLTMRGNTDLSASESATGTLATAKSTDGAKLSAASVLANARLRPPIRVPYRPPLRSPWRPPLV